MTKNPQNLPSLDYRDWLDAFQAQVARAQEQVTKLTRLEGAYRDITNTFRRLAIPNDVKITLEANGILIEMTGLPDDDTLLYEKIRSAISVDLHARNLMRNEEQNGSLITTENWVVLWKTDYKNNAPQSEVRLRIAIPACGTRDLYLHSETRTYTYTDHKCKERPEKKLIGWKRIEEEDAARALNGPAYDMKLINDPSLNPTRRGY